MGAFGDRCKTVAREYGLKRAAIAEAVSYDASYVSKWMNSGVLPSSSAAAGVCRLMAGMAARQAEEDEQRCSVLEEELFADLYQAYLSDARALSQRAGRCEDGDGRGLGRVEQVYASLDRLRAGGGACVLSIIGDVVRLDARELVFLIDVIDHVHELDFPGGDVYLVTPEPDGGEADGKSVLAAIVNLCMMRSKVRFHFHRALLSHTGLSVLGDTFLYTAQGWGLGCWLFEDFVYDRGVIGRRIEHLGRAIMPTSHKVLVDVGVEPKDGAEGGRTASFDYPAKAFWQCADRMLLGLATAQFCSESLLDAVAPRLAPAYADRCEASRASLVETLERGGEVECVIYRQALRKLVHGGWMYACGASVELSFSERLEYVRGLMMLLERYPNLKMKVTRSYLVKEVKHRHLPTVFFGRGGCHFLTFPVSSMLYSIVRDQAWVEVLQQGFVQVFQDESGLVEPVVPFLQGHLEGNEFMMM